jgi:heme-degrading monooxygenase HmoA
MTRQVVVFRNRLRAGVEKAFAPRADAIYGLAVEMPGFLSSKDYVAADGERLAVIEFESAETLAAWRHQPEHAAAQEEGRERWFSEYQLQVCSLVRESKFSAAPTPELPATAVDLAGGCACGAVRYRARGVPRDETLCHCRDCRRASAAPAVAWVTFDTSDIEWSRVPKDWRSSAPVRRSFCADCGTPLAFRRLNVPEETDLTLVSLDDPEALRPKDHTYTRSQLSWFVVVDGLPRFAAAR